MPDDVPLWWARVAHARDPGRTTLTGVLSGDFPPGSEVQLPGGRPAGWQVAVHQVGAQVRTIEVAMPEAPLLWYVELPESAAQPPATTLVAFSDDREEEGRLLGAADSRRAGVRGEEQVAAVRWWTGTGLVHQLYVAEQHRRRGVGGKLVRAAYALQHARGLPPLHGDGRRTELGERWRQSLPAAVAAQLAPWTETMPPM